MSLPSISDSAVKAILAVMTIASVIAGFFMKLIDSTIFMTVAATIITHYFNDKRMTNLQDQVDSKDAQLQSLNLAKDTVVLNTSDGEKANISRI